MSNTPDKLAAIRAERHKVYGDPKENHIGIAQIWAPLLQPHAAAVAAGAPLPPHVVALMMVGLKLDRMRITYHQDNYDDLRNYLLFAEQWQREHTACGEALDEVNKMWRTYYADGLPVYDDSELLSPQPGVQNGTTQLR